jgi:hypothetical protein
MGDSGVIAVPTVACTGLVYNNELGAGIPAPPPPPPHATSARNVQQITDVLALFANMIFNVVPSLGDWFFIIYY